jgi:hypothetical protein
MGETKRKLSMTIHDESSAESLQDWETSFLAKPNHVVYSTRGTVYRYIVCII